MKGVKVLLTAMPFATMALSQEKRDYKVLHVNNHFLELTTAGEEDFIGKQFSDLLQSTQNGSDGDLDTFKTSLREVSESLQKKTVNHLSFTFPGFPDSGSLLWDIDQIPIKTGDGGLDYVILIFHPVEKTDHPDDRFQDPQKIRQMLHEAQTLAKIGSWEIDMPSGKLYWSDMVRRIHEVESDYEPTLEEAIKFYQEGEHRDAINRAVDESMRTGETFDIELKIVTAKGNVRWVRATGNSEKTGGRVSRVYGVTHDIHNRKIAELERKLALEDLQTKISELHCLHRLSDLSNRTSSIGQLLQNVADILPEEWHAPEPVYVCVQFEHQSFTAGSRKEASSEIEEKRRLDSGEELTITLGFSGDEAGSEADHELLVSVLETLKPAIQQRVHRNRLKQSESRLKGLIESQTTYFARTDLKGKFIYHNQKFEEDFGWIYPGGKISGKNSLAVIAPSDRKKVRAVMRRCIEVPGRVFQVEAAMRSKEGDSRYILLECISIKNYENQPSEIQVSGIDVTDLKEAEKTLIHREKLLGAGSAIVTHLLQYENWYDALEKIFGIAGEAVGVDRVYYFENSFDEQGNGYTNQRLEWTKDSVQAQINNPNLQNVSWDDITEFITPLKKRKSFNAIIRELPDGNTRETLEVQDILSILVLPIFIEDEFHGFLGFDDCTRERIWSEEEVSFLQTLCSNLSFAIEKRESVRELERVNDNLASRTRELARSNEELERFAFITSHELQEPLRMIHSFISRLRDKHGDSLDEKGQAYIRYAIEGAQRMRQVILDLLEFSRVRNRPDDIDTVDVNILMAEVLTQNRKAVRDARASIQYGKLPEIVGSRSALRKVFQILINNALKYRRSKVPPEIQITGEDRGEHWLFSVSDNGIGIEPEYLEKIFQLFQRLHTDDEYPGSGIGLAIAKKIIDTHGGQIEVESTPGEGSLFRFSIAKSQPEDWE